MDSETLDLFADPKATCPVCSTARPDGSWTVPNVSHCRTCHRTWGQHSRQAHCATCHEHFTTPGNFDLHLFPLGSDRLCQNPAMVVRRDRHSGICDPKLRRRDDGVWCGAGEWPTELDPSR